MIEVRARRLFLLTFALTFYGLGASIIEGFVNYPTWHLVGQSTFQAFHQAVGPKVIGFLVAPLFVTSLLTASLLWFRPSAVPRWLILFSLGLQLLVWSSTLIIQVPIQLQLSQSGLSLPLLERLITTDRWLRQGPKLMNALLFIWMLWRLLSPTLPITSDRRFNS